MHKFLTFCLIIITATSCTNKLSNDDALNIIKAEYPTFCFTKKLHNKYNTFNGKPDKLGKIMLPIANDLKEQGLVTIQTENRQLGVSVHKLILTEKAKELGYGGKQFGFAQNDFLEVTGISQTENEAIVRYKVKRKKTPFYPLHEAYFFNKSNKRLECVPQEFELDITLVKFDDGWKIK